MDPIQRFYQVYDEWNRFERHPVEYAVSIRYLEEYLKGERLSVLDVGGGPGRYALYLAEKGHRVTLVDLTPKHVRQALEKARERGVALEQAIVGDARTLDGISGPYDAVLLMGPLYHMVHKADRKQAICQALKVLRPGGLLITTFLSAYGPLLDLLARLDPEASLEEAMGYFTNGVNRSTDFPIVYFSRPQEAQSLMNGFDNLEELAFAGLESILSIKEPELLHMEAERMREWLDIAYRLSRDPNLIGTAMHLMYIGKKCK